VIFDIRFGTPDDTGVIADFILAAGGGIFEQLLDEIVPSVSVRDLVALAVSEEDSPLNFRNCLLAQVDGRCLGMAMCYPAAQYGLPAIARGIVTDDRIEPIREIINSRIDGSFYLGTLAVSPEVSDQGLGKLLTEMVAELGRTAGFTTISLHAWTDNAPGFRLYESLGFKIRELLYTSPSSYLRHHGPIALMSAPIESILDGAKNRVLPLSA
jgi:ribosomal protein S18 acetylase RimI-like enzyme